MLVFGGILYYQFTVANAPEMEKIKKQMKIHERDAKLINLVQKNRKKKDNITYGN